MEVDRSTLIRENRQIMLQMEQLANRAMARKGLTLVQAHMLLFILRHSEEGTSLTEIHRKFGYSMAALSGLVKRLREKGYVRVEPCAQDDRRKLLFGTEKGEQVRMFLDQSISAAQSQIYGGFSEEELEQLDRMQKRVLRNLADLMRNINKEATVT